MTKKWFTVAREGQTTDDRIIERTWLEDIAATYAREKYGARIWLEHIRGIVPDSQFRAYGDVLAVRTQEASDGKLELQAQLDPTPDLVAMTKARQKIYSSIEIQPNFAKSGRFGLVGLGVTDSPASLGTSVLEFAAKNTAANPFSSRKLHPENIFSSTMEIALDFESSLAQSEHAATATILSRLGEFFSSLTKNARPEMPPESNDAMRAFSEFSSALQTDRDAISAKLEAFSSELADIKKTTESDVKSLRELMDKEPNRYHQRPTATGSTGDRTTTDC